MADKLKELLDDSITPFLTDFKFKTNIPNLATLIPNPESIQCLRKNESFVIQMLFQ